MIKKNAWGTWDVDEQQAREKFLKLAQETTRDYETRYLALSEIAAKVFACHDLSAARFVGVRVVEKTEIWPNEKTNGLEDTVKFADVFVEYEYKPRLKRSRKARDEMHVERVIISREHGTHHNLFVY